MTARIAILLLLVFVGVGPAASLAEAAVSVRLPLPRIAPVQNHHLRGAMDRVSFSLPIPERWKVLGATLRFSYVNSSALLPRISRLVFTLGGRPLAQVRLNPDTPEGSVTVPLPPELLAPGYHECTFWVVQHYTEEECEDPFAPELWTWLNLEEAHILFEIEPRTVPLRVSAIADFLFDPRNAFDTRVHLVVPDLSPSALRAASLVASGIALRYAYRTPEISLDRSLRPGVDNIAIGRRADLAPLLPAGATAEPGGGAEIRVRPLPERLAAAGSGEPRFVETPAHALVLVTGGTEAELETACRAFASLSYPLPDAAASRIEAVRLPEVEEHQVQRGLLPGKTYTFASLGKRTTEFLHISPPPLDLELRLPAGLHLAPNAFASVILHMAYDAAMRSDSVLNILLNGKFIAAVRLDNPKGDYFKGYRIDIPFSSFKRGLNRLSLEAELTPLHTDKCTLIQTENLRLTVFDDSAVILPEAPFWTRMPRLDLFFQDAFPLGRWPDLREAAVVLTEKTPQAAAAAVNAVALCAQKLGYPPAALGWAVAPEALPADRDLLVVGALSSIPAALLAASPVRGLDPLRLTFPLQPRPRPHAAEPVDFWARPPRPQAPTPTHPGDTTAHSPVQVDLTGILGAGRGAMMQFQHPQASGRTVTLLATGDAAELPALGRLLWEPTVQAAVQGDFVLLRLTAERPAAIALDLGPTYYIGAPGRIPALQNFINSHPLPALGVLLALLLVLCILLVRLIRGRRRERLSAGEAE